MWRLLGAIALFFLLGLGYFPGLDRWGTSLEIPQLHGVAQLVSHGGDSFCYLLAAGWAICLYRCQPGQLSGFLLLLAGQHILMLATKQFFHTFRPERLHQVGGFAFPSGHTLMATCVYGYFAERLPTQEWRLRSLWLSFPVLVAWSRVALGAHWLSDTLGGLLLGWIWLMVCSHLRRRALCQAEQAVKTHVEGNLCGTHPAG